MNARFSPVAMSALSPGAGMVATTADARTTTPRQFLDALGLSSPEQREARRAETRERCIRLIQVGAPLYGWPPSLVAECREIMGEREAGDSGWALAERSAYGMPGVAK